MINKKDFQTLLRELPEIGIKIIDELSNRIERLEDTIQNMGIKNVDVRVNAVLLEFANKYGKNIERGLEIDLPLSREGIANYIGLTRETVSRKLNLLQEEGIIETLQDADFKCSVYIEYMDWKNYPTDENLEMFYSGLYYKYAKKHLDIIITTDDAALEFALNNRENLFPNTPIVFCGVNEKGIQKLLQNTSNVTGVAESVDIEKTVEATLNINPDLKEIAVVYDNTESGISTGELAIQEIHRVAPGVIVKTLNDGTYSDILNQVDRILPDSAILITTNYMDDEGVVVGFEDFCELISKRSPVPVYHLYEFGMNHGAIGGSMLS
jgi:DNA-binding MarR family transcriptional regulator